MAYCGICNNHDVKFESTPDGYYCSGCDEINYYDELDKDNIIKTLRAAKQGKSEGWKNYPNCEFLGQPIDDVILEYENKAKKPRTNPSFINYR